MVQICEEGIAKRLASRNGIPFYLVVETWRGGKSGIVLSLIEAFTVQKEAVKKSVKNRNADGAISGQLLKVIPAEQRWEILEAYERGK